MTDARPLFVLVPICFAMGTSAGCESKPAPETVTSSAANEPPAGAALPTASISASHPSSLAVGAWPGADSDCPIRKCKPRPRRQYAPDKAEPLLEEGIAEQLEAEQDEAYFEPLFAQARETALPISRSLLAADPHHEVGRTLAFPRFERLFSRRQSFASNLAATSSTRPWLARTTRIGFSTFSQRNHAFVVEDAMGWLDAMIFAWPSDNGAVVVLELHGDLTFVLPGSTDECEASAEGQRGRALLAVWDTLPLLDDICSPPSGLFRSEAPSDVAGISFRGQLEPNISRYVSAYVQADRIVLDLQHVRLSDGQDDPHGGPPPPYERAKFRWSQ